MGETGEKKRVKGVGMHSITTKIVLLSFLIVVLTSVLSATTFIPMFSADITSITKNYMSDMALMIGESIDREIGYVGAEQVLTVEELGAVAGDIKVSGMESSYAYVVAADGTMMYHPTADKIGQPVENDAVKQLLAEIGKGNRPETDVITYDFKGVTKYASYYIGQNMDYIVVVTADEDETLESLNAINTRYVTETVFAVLVCNLIALVLALFIVKPIKRATGAVTKLATLDFTKDENLALIAKRKDEIGIMGQALVSLRKELVAVVRLVTGQSREIYTASETMSESASETSRSVDQVEKAIAEIAQGASSQAEETQTATENVIVMGNMIEETNSEVENLRANARAMRDAGNKAIDILNELNSINQKTGEAIQIISGQTTTTNESVSRIKDATDMITDIAEETNLLSLNASIEAARAGEQGRGFAVVAGQIQKLAEQSNESAKQIADIINLVISDSEKTVQTMEEVKEVIKKQNEHVMNTEHAFNDVKDGIDKSIEGIREIAAKTEKLDEARTRVVDVVQNLTAIAQENAASTEETSASAVEVGAIMTTIAENAQALNQIANELEESFRKFVIE